jgi:hypothetical protein
MKTTDQRNESAAEEPSGAYGRILEPRCLAYFKPRKRESAARAEQSE